MASEKEILLVSKPALMSPLKARSMVSVKLAAAEAKTERRRGIGGEARRAHIDGSLGGGEGTTGAPPCESNKKRE